MEYVHTNDTVIFTANFYHPVSGYSVAADATPCWLVYKDNSATAMSGNAMTARTDFPGSYYGTFDATLANGFVPNAFYDVQVSGSVENINGMMSVKQFVLDDIFNVNIVQVSGEYVGLANQAINANVVQVSGALVHINDFKADVSGLSTITAANVRTEMDANSLQFAAISGSVAGLAGASMRGTDDAVLATNLDAVSGVISALNNVSTSDLTTSLTNYDVATRGQLMAVSGSILDANIVSVSGTMVNDILDVNIVQISGELVHINDFKADVSSLDADIYFAHIKYISDVTNNADEFAVHWFKNDQPVASGSLTGPAISVYNTNTGAALISNQSMTYASPNLGVVRYNNTPMVLASGEPYLVETSGTIDTSVRTWKTIIGIDLL